PDARRIAARVAPPDDGGARDRRRDPQPLPPGRPLAQEGDRERGREDRLRVDQDDRAPDARPPERSDPAPEVRGQEQPRPDGQGPPSSGQPGRRGAAATHDEDGRDQCDREEQPPRGDGQRRRRRETDERTRPAYGGDRDEERDTRRRTATLDGRTPG